PLRRNWKTPSGLETKIVEHKRQSDGHNCGPLILKFAETYLWHKDISTVEITQEALTTSRRKIAILLMRESGNNFVTYT
ncbi:hypothetical protein G0U57_013060, partial [Chelydra serpentina]